MAHGIDCEVSVPARGGGNNRFLLNVAAIATTQKSKGDTFGTGVFHTYNSSAYGIFNT